ncbi:hypothetical protein GMI69_08920 [Eggerthellaceae bacterium zg-887]|uniref:hypothetical protein n=1 Tax=Xiamenia xianingshaonis TaxID=2682776 RepID=UPI00140E8825|nr:hypothetical protein [Xiamenia xianingshaonis]NHM16771.1 hypothetical protein [Xiamenia xianingshaonis]
MNKQETIDFVAGQIKKYPLSIETIMLGPEAMIKAMLKHVGEEASDEDVKGTIQYLQDKITKDDDGNYNIDNL